MLHLNHFSFCNSGSHKSGDFLLSGTNNARLATMLRNLAVYHTKDANSLFMVRIAQGLLHMGKGTHSLSPQYSDRFLVSRASLAGLLIVLTSCLDAKSSMYRKNSTRVVDLIDERSAQRTNLQRWISCKMEKLIRKLFYETTNASINITCPYPNVKF